MMEMMDPNMRSTQDPNQLALQLRYQVRQNSNEVLSNNGDASMPRKTGGVLPFAEYIVYNT